MGTNSRFLIQLLHNAVKQELVEFVKISQIHLINSDESNDWIHALIQAEQIKTEQKAQKNTSTVSFNTLMKSWSSNPRMGSYVSSNYKGKNLIANFLANKSPPPKSTAPAAPHPNQPGTFGGQGTPMNISKACAKSKCTMCSKPWPCKDHIRKHVIWQMTFCNHQISYTMADKLAVDINCIEKDFPTGEQN